MAKGTPSPVPLRRRFIGIHSSHGPPALKSVGPVSGAERSGEGGHVDVSGKKKKPNSVPSPWRGGGSGGRGDEVPSLQRTNRRAQIEHIQGGGLATAGRLGRPQSEGIDCISIVHHDRTVHRGRGRSVRVGGGGVSPPTSSLWAAGGPGPSPPAPASGGPAPCSGPSRAVGRTNHWREGTTAGHLVPCDPSWSLPCFGFHPKTRGRWGMPHGRLLPLAPLARCPTTTRNHRRAFGTVGMIAVKTGIRRDAMGREP